MESKNILRENMRVNFFWEEYLGGEYSFIWINHFIRVIGDMTLFLVLGQG